MNPNLPLYVIDTHSLLWHFLDSPRLGPRAADVLSRVEKGEAKILIPIIVMAEIVFIVEKGKIRADIEDLIARIKGSANFEIVSLGMEQMQLLKQETAIPEMHDRMIVCEALLHDAELITSDAKIGQAGIVKTVW
ncbi:PIN domain-containing protein [Dehalococcoidia bacterium]|nr:PIN domain-containing protein [Dehalococcoidia bacterium]MCL0082845.1 PIN domain-containing protein [Dehalococcoidia bacterium]